MLKKYLIAGLMGATALGALTPAAAQQWSGRDRWNRDATGQTAPQSRSQAQTPSAQVETRRETPQPYRGRWEGRDQGERTVTQRAVPAPAPTAGIAVGEPNPGGQGQRWQGQRWQDNRADETRRDTRETGREAGRDWRSARTEDRRDWQNGQIEEHRNWRNNRTNDWRDNRNWRRDGRDFRNDYQGWSRDWRNDRRYDWQGWRNNNGSRFRPGRYYAPRGWDYGYRPYSVGIYLNNVLFSSSYWINDPYRYRLPPAYGALRWVRYYDDALLVDIRNGYVVDVIREFFW
jgi:Nickel/cobalt transporter regulator